MAEMSIFDIAGPIMVGPSSSHTAGACKIGQFARALFHGTPRKITFYLHGSFGEVYKGHATDRALLAGMMKFKTSDPRLEHSFDIAKKKGLSYKFIPKDLGSSYHPNTVKIVMENRKRKMTVIGSSVGGGMIEILQIDRFKMHLKGRAGKYLSLIVCHEKGAGVTERLKEKLAEMEGIDILSIDRVDVGKNSLSVYNLGGPRRIKLSEVQQLERETEGVDYIRSLSKLEKQ